MGLALGLPIEGSMFLRISAHSLLVYLVVSSGLVMNSGVSAPLASAISASFLIGFIFNFYMDGTCKKLSMLLTPIAREQTTIMDYFLILLKFGGHVAFIVIFYDTKFQDGRYLKR
jgi:hypothetical protein